MAGRRFCKVFPVMSTAGMDLEEQENELLAIHSILSSEEFVRHGLRAAGEIRVLTEPPSGFLVALGEGDTRTQHEISFLPAIHLDFEFPEDYPSSSPPSFTLCCVWLTHNQLASLGSQLFDLYRATGGEVVLFSWVQFLREDALGFLNIRSLLELPNERSSPYQSKDTISASIPETNQIRLTSGSKDAEPCQHPDNLMDNSHEDSRGDVAPESGKSRKDSPIPLGEEEACRKGARNASAPDQPVFDLPLTPVQALVSEILVHDAAQTHKVFQSTVFDCSVCFLSYLGSECVRIQDCGHVFCQDCLAEFCKLRITEGNVLGVTCAQAGCSALPTPDQVESLVGEELFSRYDRLLLQSTLDRMADVSYCPRTTCGSPVILEEASRVALCSVCGFAFCVTCKKTYHGRDDCRVRGKPQTEEPQQDHAELPQSVAGMTALWDDYASGSKGRQRQLESRYGRKILLGTLEDFLSEDWIAFNSKKCPYCFCTIQKDKGCNVMTCTRCRRLFCWACLGKLSYQNNQNIGKHFEQGACTLYQYA
ncbi:E3 ubiquitin-protein ligase RNF14-like isoform X2 [Nerophis ophidion]|uniref:E3 ubiquitin-protein ligase RNF14-like isoform X2 n=1 Tax=Nerophis ophidion TaxID=159077 RepID=UPI002ADFB9E5|nr:E3 ubiquitin-protein ligase RNF14-like isoform X2 [Nerophis ophidion]